jgi:NAD(P)-dependent dehydrogenase (short-subunit alcohol dehydrogenase family)
LPTILITGAGRGLGLELARQYAEWEKVLRVNLLGAAAVIESLVDNVAASERKVIAVMSSRLGSIADMGGDAAPLTAQSSVRGLRRVIGDLRRGDSGGFFSYDGSSISW